MVAGALEPWSLKANPPSQLLFALVAKTLLPLEPLVRTIQQFLDWLIDRILLPMHRSLQRNVRKVAFFTLVVWYGPWLLVSLCSVLALFTACCRK
jgi:hypothetical protein